MCGVMESRGNGKKRTKPPHYADDAGTSFKNPWSVSNSEEPPAADSWFNINIPSIASITALTGTEFPLQWARDYSGHIIRPVQVVTPDFGTDCSSVGSVKATWLGHAGFLVELCSLEPEESPVYALFDPFFSDRAGPSQYTSIPRRLPAPCRIRDLPNVQFVLISHNHYDHLDLTAINEIIAVRGDEVHFLVPKGVKSTLISSGVPAPQISELDWWEEVTLPTHTNLRFCCVPAQHNSGRGVLDQNASLWCGWVVRQILPSSNALTVYHAGDTGYTTTRGPCPAFKEIGERYGPIDLAMIPIWRGGSLSFVSRFGLRLVHMPFLSTLHATPSDALAMHRDVRARHSLAMHFGTLTGSDSEAVEPLVELEEAKAGNETPETAKGSGGEDWKAEGGFGWIDVGETAVLKIF